MTNPARTLNRHHEIRAFTLTEMAIVLGIIGIILGAIWVAASAVYESNRSARASAQVQQIIGGFRSQYGNKRVDIAGETDITPLAINNQFMPADMMVPVGSSCPAPQQEASLYTSGACGLGPWGGSVVHVVSEQTYNSICVLFDNLSQSACNRVGNAVATSNPGLTIVNINGAFSIFPPYGASASLSVSNINGLCANGNGNHVGVCYSMN
jgi:prepilin-type N-terminal cleavage/methylation domain-containing protein